jgi:hypothetical protein
VDVAEGSAIPADRRSARRHDDYIGKVHQLKSYRQGSEEPHAFDSHL